MQSVVAYIRSLLGRYEENVNHNDVNLKRSREDDFSSDEELPTYKKLKQLRRSRFPDVMSANNEWNRNEEPSKVRYVPIEVEPGHPSTSTPNDNKIGKRVRVVPIKMVDITENGDDVPRKSHSNNVVHAVIDDDSKITWVDSKNEPIKKSAPKLYINLDDYEDNENEDDDDVIYVKKVKSPTMKPYKFFRSKNNDEIVEVHNEDHNSSTYYKLQNRLNDKSVLNTSPKLLKKYQMPVGINKPYKKSSTPLPKWMQPNYSKNKYMNVNGNSRPTFGNSRSALTAVFNLDEKRNYQELIRQAATTTRPTFLSKPLELVNLAEDSASFRLTQHSQKRALDEIKLVERGMAFEREFESTKEYDPVTVASLNSSESEVEIVPSESSTSSSVRIDPVNSLRESHRDRNITHNKWLANLDSKYKKKQQQTRDKLTDVQLESDIISKLNDEQKLALVEHKLKYVLSIPESLIEETPPTVELPELTPEQEKLVDRALGPGPPGQLLVEKFNLRIHRRDLQTLAGLNWLNDEVINFYMNLLMQRSEERPDLPKVYATNTFFYPKLMQGGQAGLRRWTRKVDLFAHDVLVVPVHLGVHWCVSLVQLRARRVLYLDSMGGRNAAALAALLQYLRDEHADKKARPLGEGWTTEALKDIPQQMNGSDCGMFSCTFAEFFCRNAPFTFNQSHMPYLRRKAALEILQGRLLL